MIGRLFEFAAMCASGWGAFRFGDWWERRRRFLAAHSVDDRFYRQMGPRR